MHTRSVATNGDFLRFVSNMFDSLASKQKTILDQAKFNRNANIYINGIETNVDKIKYYLRQLYNSGAFSVLNVLKHMSKMANVGLVDNIILRKLEKAYTNTKDNESKFVLWLKKHPVLSSYFTYYLIVTVMSMGAYGATRAGQAKAMGLVESIKKGILVASPEEENKEEAKVIKTYDVNSPNFVQDFVEDNWDAIVVSLLEFETYYGVDPHKNVGENVLTYGPGMVYVYLKQKDGDYKGFKCRGKYANIVKGFTEQQIWDQVKIHLTLRGGVIPRIQSELKKNGITQVNANQIMGLVIAGYQRPKDIPEIIRKLSIAKNNSEICDAFASYKVNKPSEEQFRKGTMKRRWWCAAYYTDAIDYNNLLSLECDVFAHSDTRVFYDSSKKHFNMDNQTVEYALMLKLNATDIDTRKKQGVFVGTVADFLQKHKILPHEINVKKTEVVSEDTQQNTSMSEIVIATKAFNNKQYSVAIEHYEKALIFDSNNIEAYSNLSLTYKRLADTYKNNNDIEKALEYYNKCCDIVSVSNSLMKANKSLLLDKEIKAYTNYNAGQAHDAMANIYTQLDAFKEAISHCEKAVDNYKISLSCAKDIKNHALIDIYTRAKDNSEKTRKELKKQAKAKPSKKVAFNNATMLLKKGKTFDATKLFVRTNDERSA